MIAVVPTPAGLREAADSGGYVKAILNILEDMAEKRLRLGAAQKAVLSILADFGEERDRLGDIQKAMLNILEDSASEKTRLEAAQKAILNILEDFDVEKNRVEHINREMAREIAEREEAEEGLRQAKAAADAANRELEAFSYSVSHDLRAPLRAIDGFSRILLEENHASLSAEALHYLALVRENAQQMGALIDDLLSFSRLSRQSLKRERVRMSALAHEARCGLEGELGGRRIELVVSDLPQAYGDPVLLRQVFVNLLSNAIKFTSKKDPARIDIGSLEQDGHPVYFVRDNGEGFDMRYIDKLFGVFQRLHRSEEFPGTGVGLAIVQRIILRHGGRVWAEARVGEGATFYFTLEGGAE